MRADARSRVCSQSQGDTKRGTVVLLCRKGATQFLLEYQRFKTRKYLVKCKASGECDDGAIKASSPRAAAAAPGDSGAANSLKVKTGTSFGTVLAPSVA